MHTLLLLRHGKAVGSDPAGDHERALNALGRWQASAIGAQLSRTGLAPDLALVSDARRTRETAELALGPETHALRIEAGLYDASTQTILDFVRAVPNDIRRLLIVGHNPGIGETARLLERSGEPQAAVALQDGFPTAALAVFELDTPDWSTIGPASATLTRFIVPDRNTPDV